MTKGAHQSARFQTFNCSGEVPPNLYFDRLLLSKVYKVSAKTEQKSYVSWHWRVICFKTDKNLVNFDLSTQKSQKFALWLIPLTLTYKSTEELPFMALKSNAKFDEKWLVIWKMTSRIWQIFGGTLESVNVGTFMGSFCSKYNMHELKCYREVMCSDTEEWWKIWRGIDLSFQNWHKEFDKFWLEHLKISKICILMGCFWPKHIIFKLRKYRGVIFHDTWDWCKISRKTDLWLSN